MHKILSILMATLLGCSASIETEPQDLNETSQTVLAQKSTRVSSSGPLIDHGGKILPTSNIYTIWWGNASSFPSDAVVGINSLFQGFNGSAYLNIASQY